MLSDESKVYITCTQTFSCWITDAILIAGIDLWFVLHTLWSCCFSDSS